MALLAIDIGGSAIKYAHVSFEGEILKKDKVLNPRESLESFLKCLYDLIDQEIAKGAVEGIALSVPAAVNTETGEVCTEGSMPFLLGKSLQDMVKTRYHLNVTSENDGNCAALAEVWKGAACECKDVAMVVIGTGIGGAIIKDGKIHSGANRLSGEFGYSISNYCYGDGSFKVWSETGAVYALCDRMSRLKGRALTGIEVFDLAANGDKDALLEVDSFYAFNAIGLHNIQYAYDPQVIVIGGAISERDDFLSDLSSRIDSLYRAIESAPVKPQIRIAKFGNDANLLGAVYHFLQQTKE